MYNRFKTRCCVCRVMIRTKSLLFLISLLIFLNTAFAAEESSNKNCPEKNKVVAINVGFNYLTAANMVARLSDDESNSITDFLGGSENDLKFYNNLTKKFAGTSTSINDGSASAISHDAFIQSIKDAVKNADVVHFNYSGHGVITKNGDWALLLPGGAKCKVTQVPYNDLAKAIEDKKLSAQPYRGIFGKSFVQEAKGLEVIAKTTAAKWPYSEETKKSALGAKEKITLLPVIDDTGDCKEYVVTAAELQKTIGDKNVFGIFDSCHSGILTGYPNFSALTSVNWDELASEDSIQKMGSVCAQIQQNLKLKNCHRPVRPAYLGDLLVNSKQVNDQLEIILEKPNGAKSETIAFANSKTSKHPRLSTNLDLAKCFDYSLGDEEFPCPYETKLKLGGGLKAIKPYSSADAKEKTICELKQAEDFDPINVYTDACPKLVKVKGLTSQCEGWLAEPTLTGIATNCGTHTRTRTSIKNSKNGKNSR